MKHKEIITTDVEIMLSEVTLHNYFICVIYFGIHIPCIVKQCREEAILLSILLSLQ